MIAEYDGSNALQRRFVHGPGMDEPLVQYEGSGTTGRGFLHADERGSIVANSDGSGAMLAINRYDEYGKPQPTNSGRFQYTGQMWLGEIGLQYSKARMYGPHLGRFWQTDPIGGTNLYAYVLNDPVNLVDPLGLQAVDEIVVVATLPRSEQPAFRGFSWGAAPSASPGEHGVRQEDDGTIVVPGQRIKSPIRRPGSLYTGQTPQGQQQNCRSNPNTRRALSDPDWQTAARKALANSRSSAGGTSLYEYGFWSSETGSGDVVTWRVGTSRTSHEIAPDKLKPFAFVPWLMGTNSPNVFTHTHIPDEFNTQ